MVASRGDFAFKTLWLSRFGTRKFYEEKRQIAGQRWQQRQATQAVCQFQELTVIQLPMN